VSSINSEKSNAPRPNRPGGDLRSSIAGFFRTAKGVFFSSMFHYLVRRVIWGILMLLVVSALTFVIFYLLPAGDPAVIRAGRYATPARVAQIRHQLGLDRPVYYQYWVYMKAIIVHFDFGTSFKTNLPVRDEIFRRLPVTFSVAIGAVILWMLVGIPVGIISAIKRRSLLDRATMSASLVAISAPVYWLGLIALFLFSKDVGVIKLFGGSGSYVPFFQDPAAWLSSLILPWIVLAAAFAAFYARMVRGNLIETMNEDFIRTARAKGLTERRVIFRHGLRAALTPVVTMAGLDIGTLLGGAVLTETVFNIPGIGRLAYDSIIGSDLPMIQGTVLLSAFFIISANLIVDVLYAFLDPRVRY